MNKRIMSLLVVGSLLAAGLQSAGAVAANSSADSGIIGGPKLAVLVDARKVKFQGGDPFAENGRIQVPIRGIGEALGAEVGFSGNTVSYEKEGKKIELTIGSKTAVVDGSNVTMDTPAKALKGRTYVPLRFVSENLGETVEWDAVANWVWIGSKEIPNLEDVAVKHEDFDKFKKLIDPISSIYSDDEVAYEFDYNQLPLKIGSQILYDVWKVERNGDKGLQARFSSSSGNFILLSEKKPGARIRYPDRLFRFKNSDNSITSTYRINRESDWELIGGSKSDVFTIDQADYIRIVGPLPRTGIYMNNSFK